MTILEQENEQYLRQQLEWVNLRLGVLDEIDARLLVMREIALQAVDPDLDQAERHQLSRRMTILQREVQELEQQSRTSWMDRQ